MSYYFYLQFKGLTPDDEYLAFNTLNGTYHKTSFKVSPTGSTIKTVFSKEDIPNLPEKWMKQLERIPAHAKPRKTRTKYPSGII